MKLMLAIPVVLAVALSAAPAPARADDRSEDLSEGLSLMEQGARLLLRGLMGELEPALRDLEGVLGDLGAYHPPEILPNGDIIIRRKVPLTPAPEATPPSGDGEEIEL
jgi:hypothetical protein